MNKSIGSAIQKKSGRRLARITYGALGVIAAAAIAFGHHFDGDAARSMASDDPATQQPADVPAVDPVQIQNLINQLSAPDFDLREQATEALWQLGRDAEPALQRASSHRDREVAFRAARILERFRLGIFADTPPEKIRLIRMYSQAEDPVRLQLLRSLLLEGNFEDLSLLLDRENNAERRQQGEALVMGQLEMLAGPLIARQDWEQLDRLFDRFALNAQSQYVQVSTAFAGGPEKLYALIERSANYESESDPGRGARVRMLAHAFLNDYDSAIQAAQQLPDPQESRGWQATLMVNTGAWNDYLQLLTGTAEPDPNGVSENLVGNDLALARWAAQQSGDAAWIEQLQKAVDERLSNDAVYLTRIKLDLVIGEVESASEQAKRLDPLLYFSLLAGQDRYAEAFEGSGIGLSADERAVWFEARIAELNKAQADTPANGQTMVDEKQVKLAIEVAGWLVSLGEIQEGAEYLDRLMQALPLKLATRRLYQERILDLELRFELNEAFVKHGIEVFTLPQFGMAFGDLEDFSTWWFALEEEVRDPVERLIVIRDLLAEPRSGRVTREQVVGWVEMATKKFTDDATWKNNAPNWSVSIANTCFANQMDERGEQILRTAVETRQETQAAVRWVEWLREQKKWEAVIDAIKIAKQHVRSDSNRSGRPDAFQWDCALARALKELGREAEAQAELQKLTALSLASQLSLGQALDKVELDDEAREVLRRARLSPVGVQWPFAGNPYLVSVYLAIVTNDSIGSGDPSDIESLSGSLLAMEQPFILEPDPRRSHPVQNLLTFRELGDQAVARRAIQQRDVPTAVAALERAIRMRAGNVDNVLDYYAGLEELGARAEVDRLYESIREVHLEQLESFRSSAMHRNNMAWMSARCGRRLDEALELSTAAVEARPFEDNYVDTLGEVRFQRGELREALELAERCLTMNPASAHYREQKTRFEQALNEQE